MASKAAATARGCGRRVRGGVYLEIGVGPDGTPLDDLIVDHPIVLPVQRLGITPRGVRLISFADEPPMLVDWIGSQHYPNVLDFVEEARRFGISRRMPRSFDWARLSGATIAFLHARAAVENPETYWNAIDKTYCPTANAVHVGEGYRNAGGPCAGFWWDDVTGGEEIEPGLNRVVRRRMPSFAYLARRAPVTADPVYQPAIFMRSANIPRLVYVREHAGEGIPAELARDIAASGIECEAVDE